MDTESNRQETTPLWRLVVLYLATHYPSPVRMHLLIPALEQALGQPPDEGAVRSIVDGLVKGGVLTDGSSTHGAMAVVATDEALAVLAYGMLEYEEGIAFMETPYVSAIVNKDFFRRRAGYFMESVRDMPPELLQYLDCDGSPEDISQLYDSLVEELLSSVGVESHPEVLFWVLFPKKMASRIAGVYEKIGKDGMDEALRDPP
jgi:hypothetical protein